MKWSEYTVDSFPEVYGAMDELEEFIFHADFTKEDNRSILYMLSIAAVKESAIRSKIYTHNSFVENFGNHLPLRDRVYLGDVPYSEDAIKEWCDQETMDWRTKGEAYQINNAYQKKTIPVSELGCYIQ